MIRKTIISLFTTICAGALYAGSPSVLDLSESFIDNSIVLPESFETDVNKMMQSWYAGDYIVRDGVDNFTPDIPASDAEVIDRLSKLPTEIEMPYNSVVRSIINAYTQRRRELVRNMLGLSFYYMPIFEEALEREGLPMELKYLPVIESALDPAATSRVGAAGLWQFMSKTAKGLGMEVNTVVDERRDPYKSSMMAARYLKELYETFGDWSLAIAAYNCGPGNVNKALRRAGGGKQDFWSIYPYLHPETRTYVPGFIAANYVMNYYGDHGIAPTLARRPIVTDSVHVNKRVYFQQIADVLKIPVAEIRILNPQYRKDYIPGDIKPYPLVLPSFQIYSYIMSEDSILACDASKYARRKVVEPATGNSKSREEGDYIVTETYKYHKVKKGDTLGKIAKKYGTTVKVLEKANGKIKTLRVGQTIKIPTVTRVKKPKEPEPAPVKEPAIDGSDVVLPSDSQVTQPDSVAMVEATVDAQEDNMVTDGDADEESLTEGSLISETIESSAEEDIEDLKPGTDEVEAKTGDANTENTPEPVKEKAEAPRAPIPTEPEKPAAKTSTATGDKPKANQPVYHKVRKGESPAKIAKRYGTTTEKILKLNNLKKSSKIYPGQTLRVK